MLEDVGVTTAVPKLLDIMRDCFVGRRLEETYRFDVRRAESASSSESISSPESISLLWATRAFRLSFECRRDPDPAARLRDDLIQLIDQRAGASTETGMLLGNAGNPQ